MLFRGSTLPWLVPRPCWLLSEIHIFCLKTSTGTGRRQCCHLLHSDSAALSGTNKLPSVTVGWAAGRASGLWKLSAGVLALLSVWERGEDLHMAQLMPLPLIVVCFSKVQIGFTFLVPAHLGSPGKGPINVRFVCVEQTFTASWYAVETVM